MRCTDCEDRKHCIGPKGFDHYYCEDDGTLRLIIGCRHGKGYERGKYIFAPEEEYGKVK